MFASDQGDKLTTLGYWLDIGLQDWLPLSRVSDWTDEKASHQDRVSTKRRQWGRQGAQFRTCWGPFQKPSPHHSNLVLILIGCLLKPTVTYLPLLLAYHSSSVSNTWQFRESISYIRREPGARAVLEKRRRSWRQTQCTVSFGYSDPQETPYSGQNPLNLWSMVSRWGQVEGRN